MVDRLILAVAVLVALLMISNVATFSWGSLRIRRSWRMLALAGVGLLGAALVTLQPAFLALRPLASERQGR